MMASMVDSGLGMDGCCLSAVLLCLPFLAREGACRASSTVPQHESEYVAVPFPLCSYIWGDVMVNIVEIWDDKNHPHACMVSISTREPSLLPLKPPMCLPWPGGSHTYWICVGSSDPRLPKMWRNARASVIVSLPTLQSKIQTRTGPCLAFISSLNSTPHPTQPHGLWVLTTSSSTRPTIGTCGSVTSTVHSQRQHREKPPHPPAAALARGLPILASTCRFPVLSAQSLELVGQVFPPHPPGHCGPDVARTKVQPPRSDLRPLPTARAQLFM